MVEFYLLTFPRFPLRKKEHKSFFGKNRTHDFRTTYYSNSNLLLTNERRDNRDSLINFKQQMIALAAEFAAVVVKQVTIA